MADPLAPTRRLALALALALAAGPVAAQQKTLVVGSYPSNPPWEFKNAQGVFEGFEIDVAKEVAKRLGMGIEISDYGFQALFAATANRIDVAVSSISITQERLKNQGFTQGYFTADNALVTRKDSKVKSLATARGATVGAIAASVGEAWIKANTEKYGFGGYKSYDTQQNLLLDLQAGRIDGAVGDVAGFQYAFAKMTELTVAELIKRDLQIAMMMRKDHPLLPKINDVITEMKKDGTMAALHKTWLGEAPAPESATVKVMPLPKAE